MSTNQKKKNLGDYLKIALLAGSAPSKDELFQILFYFRQVLGLMCGIAAGCLGLSGIFTLAGFLAVNCLITYVYTYTYLRVDNLKVEQNELFTEALMISVMNFIITWIFTYTFIFLKSTVPLPLINSSTADIITSNL